MNLRKAKSRPLGFRRFRLGLVFLTMLTNIPCSQSIPFQSFHPFNRFAPFKPLFSSKPPIPSIF